MMDSLIPDLNRVLRYSADTVENLLGQLQHPTHNQTRWGGLEADHTFRGVLADALDEADRPAEAGLLRNPDQRVLVDGGKVRAGRFADRETNRRYIAAVNHLADWADDLYVPPDIDWAEDQTPVSNGLLGVRHYSQDDPEQPTFHLIHHSQLGNHLADAVVDSIGEHPQGDAHQTAQIAEHRRLLYHLRNSPYEVVDRTHPTESASTS